MNSWPTDPGTLHFTATLGGEIENLMEQVGDRMGEPYPSQLCKAAYLAGQFENIWKEGTTLEP